MSDFTIDMNTQDQPICRNGKPLSKQEILIALNRAESIARAGRIKIEAFERVNSLCWSALGDQKKVVPIEDVLSIIESYCGSLMIEVEKRESPNNTRDHFFLYSQGNLETFSSVKERDEAAELAIESHLDDCWDEEVNNLVAGVITHKVKQVNRQERPENVDEDGISEDGDYWQPEWEYKCNYQLRPIDEVEAA